MSRLSLRARLLLLATGLVAAALVVTSGVAVGSLQSFLVGRIDAQLRPIAEIFSLVPRIPTLDAADAGPELLGAGYGFLGNPYVAELAPDGSVAVQVLPAGPADRPPLPRLDTAAVAARAGQPFDLTGPDAAAGWRVIALPRRPPPQPGAPPEAGSVVVAISRADADATIGRLVAVSLVTSAVLLAVLSVAAAVAVRVGLRPLRRIEDTAAAIAGGDLSHRIPDLASSRTEVGRLAAALNGMLVQLETAFGVRAESEAKMRRFVADVSHELRTPLFGIKGFAELYRMGGLPERADVDRTMSHIEAESSRLARLTEDLLLLAQLDNRADGDPDRLMLGPTDLRTLAVAARHDLRALDPDRPVRLTGPDGGPPATAQMLGDEARLRQVVVNLVGNVIAHTPPGSAARIGVGTVDGQAVLEIEDSGPGLTADEAERVFDRFYRVDGSRVRDERGGAGLGLAIVQSIVAAHGGRVELRTAPGEGATFRAAFPALPASDGS